MSLPDNNSGTAEQKVAQVAQAILDGRISIIAGARQIRRLCGGHAGLDERDPDLTTFVGIDSETDDLPIGDVSTVLGSRCTRAKRLGDRALRSDLSRARVGGRISSCCAIPSKEVDLTK